MIGRLVASLAQSGLIEVRKAGRNAIRASPQLEARVLPSIPNFGASHCT